jgi:pSer/pThr/pTyr-binding forkhead associated (FHA) protein
VGFSHVDDLDTGMFRITSEAKAGVTAQGPPAVGAPPPVAARLDFGDRAVALTRRTTTIGRGDDVDLRIDDPGVSRKHAQIVLGDPCKVIDLGSTNGTYLDKTKVTGPTPVPPGVPVRIGKTSVELRK